MSDRHDRIAELPPLDCLGPYTACGECGATDRWTFHRAWARCECGYVWAFNNQSQASPTPEQIAAACELVMAHAMATGRCRYGGETKRGGLQIEK